MKIGAIIIHSTKYESRRPYVDGLIHFFKDTDVEVNVIEGVFTDQVYYDARKFMHTNRLSKGQIGASLAHMNAYKLGLEKGYDAMFIFEDDVIINKSYTELKIWIDNLPMKYDILLLTNIGIFEGIGHDGRQHHKVAISKDVYSISCAFGSMAYYISGSVAQHLHDTQNREMNRGCLFLADGLPIHCEKRSDVFLNIITPIDAERFFKHNEFELSVVNSNV